MSPIRTTAACAANTAACVALALLSSVGVASAHATLEQKSADANSTYKGVMRIGHGCDGAATHTLEVRLPDGFINAKPMPKAGWTVETETGAYDQAYEYYGRDLTEGVRLIRWVGGPLSDAHYDEFVFRGALRGHDGGETLAFPTVQLCTEGRHDWVETAAPGQDPHDLDSPAPTLTIVAATGHGHAHGAHSSHGAQSASDGGSAAVGDLVIEGAWTRQPPPGARVGGGYMRITNNGSETDRLIGGSVGFADVFQVHEMSVVDGVMRMREVSDGLEIPAGETVMLQPGGYHVMFMEITEAPTKGAVVPVTLRFQNAGEVTVDMPVAAIGAPRLDAEGGAAPDHGAAGHDHGHGAMQHGTTSN